MEKLFIAYESAKDNTIRGDFIDRLHSRITVVFLFALCILIGYKQYEAQFNDDQADYTHQLCWVNNTYYYPGVHDADLFPESNRNTILYYQYILFIIFGQAMMFYLPTMIWNVLSRNSIGYIKKMLDQAQKSNAFKNIKRLDDESQKKTVKSLKARSTPNEPDTGDELNPLILDHSYSEKLMSQFKSIVSFEHNLHNHSSQQNKNGAGIETKAPYLGEEKPDPDFSTNKSRLLSSRRNKSKVLSFMKPTFGVENLTWHYMFLKLLNLINVVIQLVLLNYMFGGKFFTYGIDFFVSLFNNENPFFLTTQFPIITFCDFLVYQNLRKIHYNAAQCILPINVLIEKFFLLVWFWYYLLLILTLVNILSWSIELLPSKKIGFIDKYLNIRQKMQAHHRSMEMHSYSAPKPHREVKFDPSISSLISLNEIRNFYHEYFGSDGVTMLHLIKSVAGDIIFLDLLSELWNDYTKQQSRSRANTDSAAENTEQINA